MNTDGCYPGPPWPPSAHVKLPRGWEARDFRLSIRWLPDGSRTARSNAAVPGFYLRACFANEGGAFAALPGHKWNDDVLIGPQTLSNVLVSLSGDANVPTELLNLGAPLGEAVRTAQSARVTALVQAALAAEDSLAKARAALAAEGIDPDSVR